MSNFKDHLISAGITFAATFFLVVSIEIARPEFAFTKETLTALGISAIVAAVRSIAKIIYELCYDLLSKKEVV